MNCIHIGPGVELRGIRPEMACVDAVVLAAFNEEHPGLACWLTSAVRPGDKKSLHGYGLAKDYDCQVEIEEPAGKRIEKRVQGALGPEKPTRQFYALWHQGRSGRWHLHVELDPGNKGVAPYQEA